MSIRDFNNVVKKPGCMWTIAAFSLLAMGGGIFGAMKGCSGNQGNDPSQAQKDKPVIIGHVGDFPIDQTSILKQVDQEQQKNASLGQPGPKLIGEAYAVFLNQQVDLGLHLAEAQKLGMSITDDAIRNLFKDQLEMMKLQMKMQLMQGGKLKPDASDADFEKAYQDATQHPFSEFKGQQDQALKSVLANADLKKQAMAAVAEQKLPDFVATRYSPTEDQVKATFVTVTVKRILFGKDGQDQAAKAQAELKSGTSFETLIDRYSKDIANKGKKPSETETSLDRNAILASDAFKPLLTMKVGEVTDIVDLPAEGTAIYKVIRVKAEPPKDWDTKKKDYVKEYARNLGENQIKNDVKTLAKSGIIKFTDVGWETLYNYSQLALQGLTPEQRSAKLDELAKKMRGAASGDSKVNAIAFFMVIDDLYTNAKPDKKDSYEDDRLASIEAADKYFPDGSNSIELARIYAKQKKGGPALEALSKAVEETQIVSPSAAGAIAQIQLAEQELVSQKLASDDQLKPLNDAIAKWKSDKKQYDDEQEQARQAQMQAQIQQAKEKADFEKAQREQAKKDAPSKGTTPPAGDKKGTKPGDSKSALPSVTGQPSAPPIDLGTGGH